LRLDTNSEPIYKNLHGSQLESKCIDRTLIIDDYSLSSLHQHKIVSHAVKKY